MPGLCGLIDPSAAPASANLVADMTTRLAHYPWQRSSRKASADGRAVVGAVVLDHRDKATGLTDDGQDLVAFDGELYNGADIRAELARRDARQERNDGALGDLIARGLRAQGLSFLATLRGYFCAAIWDARRGTLTLVADAFGLRPLYWARTGKGLAFSSEVSPLLLHPEISRRVSPGGVAQFVAFGQLFGQSTLFESIQTVPAGSTLEFEAATGELRISNYLGSRQRESIPASRHDALELVADRFAAAVQCRTQESTPGELGLSLSGGLDARTILALVPPHVSLTTVSLGIPGSMDHKAAGKLSALVGRAHHAQLLDRDFLGGFEAHLRQMVRLTDGHYLDQGIVMTTLPSYRQLGIRTLLRGHAGELLHMRKAYAFSLDEAALKIADDKALATWLEAHLTNYMIGAVDGPLFTDAMGADVREIARTALSQALEPLSTVMPPLQRVWPLFVRERLRRETALSLHMFRNFVEVRVPYLDDDLVDLLYALPTDLKIDDTLQAHILKRYQPGFLGIVNTNTGAAMGASPLTERLTYLRMKVFAKLGVPGYQPYERLGLWLSTDLKPLVHGLLLNDRFHDRGIFLPDQVKRIVAQHESRERNHTFLIMAMMILELGSQQLLDSE